LLQSLAAQHLSNAKQSVDVSHQAANRRGTASLNHWPDSLRFSVSPQPKRFPEMRFAMRFKGVAFGLMMSVASGALAQGVPIIDAEAFAEKLKAYVHLEHDYDTQVEKANNRAELKDFEQQQIESLDRMIEAFSSVSTFNQAFVYGEDGQYEGVEQVYGPLANPGGAIMFGDAKENIEQLIVRGTQDTYGLPGVAAAGLSPLQWRCLIQALIWQESRFQIGARSPADAFGLTQIIPGTAKELGIYPEYYNDPYVQVVGGARYIAKQLQRFNGNIIFALAAYNAGPGAVQKYGGVPPFKETQHYVQVIPEKYNSYLRTIGGAEALGTLDPAEYAVANASLMSSGSMHYAEHSLLTAQQALMRVRALVEKIDKTVNVKEAYDLNSAMKAEIILILSARIRTKAAKTQATYSQVAWVLARQRESMKAADFALSEF